MKVNPSFELLKSLPSLQFSSVFPLRTPSPIMVWIWTEWSWQQDLSLTTWFLDIKVGILFLMECVVSLHWNLSAVLQLGDDVTDIPQDPLLLAGLPSIRTISTFRHTTWTNAWNHQFHNQKKHPKKADFTMIFSNLCYVESSPSGSHLVTSPDCPGDAAGLEGSNQPMHPPPEIDHPWIDELKCWSFLYTLCIENPKQKNSNHLQSMILYFVRKWLCFFVGKSLSLN